MVALGYLERFALVLGGISAAYWIVGSKLASGSLAYHLWGRKLELMLVPYGCFFALGVLVYIVSRQGYTFKRLVGIVVFAAAGVVEIGFKTDFYLKQLNAGEPAFLPQAVFVAALIFILLSMRFTLSKSNPVARVTRTLGLATYPLYLIHQIVGLRLLALALEHGANEVTAIILAAFCCFALALLIATLVEPPIQNALRTVFARLESALKKSHTAAGLFRATVPVPER